MEKKKDWKGTGKALFVCNGATGHAQEEREENDFYATDPIAGEFLLELEPQLNDIWENACGQGHLAEVFRKAGKLKVISDLIDRDYKPEGVTSSFGKDFMQMKKVWRGDIVTNPPYACVDSETEVLTKEGWVYFKDIKGDEDILSCNAETRQLEYSKIDNVIRKEVDEELLHFSTPFIDLKVTKDHRMFCVHNRKDYVQKIGDDVLRANQVYKTSSALPRYGYSYKSEEDLEFITIPGCYVSNGKKDIWHEDIIIPINDWLEFFGIWIADGCYRDSENSQGNQRYTISIKQHEKTVDEVIKIVKKLPFTTKIMKNKGNNTYNIEINSKQLWLYMSQFGKSDTKFIPTFIKLLPADKLKVFLKGYMFGDCTYLADGHYLLQTISNRLAWDLHEVILKIGSIASISSRFYKTKAELERELWQIYYHEHVPAINRKSLYGVPNKEHYKGLVYCLTLEKNGFMVVRRNGKVSITGNCATDWVEHSLELLQEGRFLALFMKISFLEGKTRRKLFEENPPIRVWVSSSRINCAKNGDFVKYGKGSATCYCWYIWQKGYKGPTEVKWFN